MTANTFAKWLATGAALTAAVMLVGCANLNQKQITDEQKHHDQIEGDISNSLSQAVTAQRELAMTRDASVQQRAQSRTRLLTDRVNYDFYGDVETIVDDIATKYGYDFRVFGRRPPEHVNVNVLVKQMPVLDVLRYVGQTAGDFIDIHVTQSAIELTYKSHQRG
jgi:hypothetical protein